MRLSVSNIAWDCARDEAVYELMRKYGYTGVEIAPTRIFPENPYDRLGEAKTWSEDLRTRYGFQIPSMQSVWYGRQESIFGSDGERQTLLSYTKKAIDFASVTGCRNLVFGCPRNRNLPDGAEPEAAVAFFRELGEYAVQKGTVIGMEANPPIYNTNYINTTESALELIHQVDSDGFRLNLDVGTMIENDESVKMLAGNVRYISHVHISEPYLAPVQTRPLHAELRDLLLAEDYQGYVSIETKRQDNTDALERQMAYVAAVFH